MKPRSTLGRDVVHMGGKESACLRCCGNLKGESRCTWEGKIEMSLKLIGTGIIDWLNFSQDTDKWLAFLNTVMNLQNVDMFWQEEDVSFRGHSRVNAKCFGSYFSILLSGPDVSPMYKCWSLSATISLLLTVRIYYFVDFNKIYGGNSEGKFEWLMIM